MNNFGREINGYFSKRPQPMTKSEFEKLSHFIKRQYGLDLSGRKTMVENRLLNYVIDRGFESFSEYLQTVYSGADDGLEAANLINRLTTNYTYFLREQEHYEHFTQVFLPSMEERINEGELCIWSAGCSFGNEAYTFAACMEEYFEWHGGSDCDRRILATDISRNALVAARQGSYGEAAVKALPPHWVNKYFNEHNGIYTVTDRLRSQVVFRYHNLMDPITFKKKFDLIVCRNVMIYFDAETNSKLLKRFYDATNKGGRLYIGHAEAVPKDCLYRREQPAVLIKD